MPEGDLSQRVGRSPPYPEGLPWQEDAVTKLRAAADSGHALAEKLHCSYDCGVSDLRFEWDSKKARANATKHGVSFEEASTVFFDENGLFMSDPAHSDSEDRFVLLGFSQALKLLVVCHCYRESEEIIRIISARKADRSERRQYEERLRR